MLGQTKLVKVFLICYCAKTQSPVCELHLAGDQRKFDVCGGRVVERLGEKITFKEVLRSTDYTFELLMQCFPQSAVCEVYTALVFSSKHRHHLESTAKQNTH